MKHLTWKKTAGITGCLLLYLLPCLFLGSRQHSDSAQYIAMHIHREPLYPLWLLFFRTLFPDPACYTVASLAQCVVNGLATYFFAVRMRGLFSFGPVRTGLSALAAFIPQAMTYLASENRLFLAGDILSESLAYPGLLVTLILLSEMAVTDADGKKKQLPWVSVLMILLLSLFRGQMIVLIVVWLIVFLLRSARQVLPALVVFVLFFACRNLFIRTYFYAIGEGFETHSIAMSNAVAHVLYVAERADSTSVPDDEPFFDQPELTLRDYYLLMYDRMDTMRMNLSYEEGSLYARNSYMESCRDAIAYDIAWRAVYDAIDPFGYDYNTEDAMSNDVNGALVKALMPVVFVRWSGVYVRHILQGLIRSIGFTHPVLSWVFLGMIFTAIVLTARMFFAAPEKSGFKRMALAAVPVLLFIAGNACAVALLQFCIPRYMFYAFPFFYVLYGNMIYEMISKRRKGAS